MASLSQRLTSAAVDGSEVDEGIVTLFVRLATGLAREDVAWAAYAQVKSRLPPEAKLRQSLWMELEEYLVEHGRYAETLAEQAVGLAAIRAYVASFRRVSPDDERKHPVIREAIEFTIRHEGGMHYEALLGGGDLAGARVVADELVDFRSTCRTFAVLIERALRVGVSEEAARLRDLGARVLPAGDQACLSSPSGT